MRMPADIGSRLAAWLPRQRWFAGTDQEIEEVLIVADTIVSSGDPELRHVVIDVCQDGNIDRYQLLIGLRPNLPQRLRLAEIASDGSLGGAYDAVHDPELTTVLLRQFARGVRVGPLSFRLTPGTRIDAEVPGRLRMAEQSNTSIIFGDAYICKLFRRISPMPSPDLELNLGLAQTNCPYVPKLYGWVEDEVGATLALLSQYLPGSADGWKLAAESARHFVFGPASLGQGARPAGRVGSYQAEAASMGAVTAAVHDHLARAFGVSTLSAMRLSEVAEGMRGQLADAVAAVPELAAVADQVAEAFDDLAALDASTGVQPIHGDLHLAQFLRTRTGWMVVDFEGEPYRATQERIAWASPLRDVAGMLRSFEYSAWHLLLPDEQVSGEVPGPGPAAASSLALRAERWTRDCSAAYCRGYAQAGGIDPAAHSALLRAFVYDKAVYEVLFECRHRPSWLSIPLTALFRAGRRGQPRAPA
jgi:trehalose synthase-fused probable maltokinase